MLFRTIANILCEIKVPKERMWPKMHVLKGQVRFICQRNSNMAASIEIYILSQCRQKAIKKNVNPYNLLQAFK